jgi:hypothetical protein
MNKKTPYLAGCAREGGMCQMNEKNPPALEVGRGVIVVHPSPVALVIVVVDPLRHCHGRSSPLLVTLALGIGVVVWHWH